MFNGHTLPTSECVLHAQQRRGVWKLLVKWSSLHANDATWETLDSFCDHFPNFQLKGKLFS